MVRRRDFMGKVEVKKQKKKDALFNTAFELFTTKGTNQTTISDIVNKAGVAKGTFYLYFKDKYDIRNKLVSHKTSELFYQAYRAVIDQEITGFRNQLHFMIDFILDALESDSPLLMFISRNLSWVSFRQLWMTKFQTKILYFMMRISDFLRRMNIRMNIRI